MEALVQRLAPPPAHVDPDEYSVGGDGEGNLNALGVVRGMQVPRVPDPAAFLSTYTNSMSQNPQAKIKLEHGTTTLAFRFRGGIIVSVDSRATAGSYIASGTVKKVIEINKYLLGTMAGGAADCQYWETYLGMRCRMHELRNKERISVAAASKLLANIVYEYKGQGLSMGTMICGWDKTGPQIFYVDSEGTRLKGNVFAVGSGATFAYGVLDQGYSYDLSDEDAQELGRRAIVAAGHRDAYSGNTNNLFHVREDGWEFLGNKDISELWYKYEQEKKDARHATAAGSGADAGAGKQQGENAARPTTEVQPVPMEE